MKKVPVKPGNVYGEGRHPINILRDPQNKKGWRDVEESVKQPTKNAPPDAPVPGPSDQPPPPMRETSLPDVSPTPSEKDVEAGLDPDYWGVLLSHIGPGGGSTEPFLPPCKSDLTTHRCNHQPQNMGVS